MVQMIDCREIKYKRVLFIIFLVLLSTFVLSAEAQDDQSYYQDGYQFFSQGDYQKAGEYYQKAIEINQDFEDAHYWLGKVYRQTGQYNKAVQQWIEVLRINPRNPYAFRYLNESFRNTSEVQNGTADQYYSQGLKMLEAVDESFLNENNYTDRDLLLAIPYFKKAIDFKSDFTGAYYWLGEIYQALSKKISWQFTSMAISNFEKAIGVEQTKENYTFEMPSHFWYSYQELMLIYQSLGLNQRKENLLIQLQEIKAKPYEQLLTQAGYNDLGYPDHIQILAQDDQVIEIWKYNEQGKTFRVVNKEFAGEENTYYENIQNEETLSINAENLKEQEQIDEGE